MPGRHLWDWLFFCLLFDVWIYFRRWEVSKISNWYQFTNWCWKYGWTKNEQLLFTLFKTCADGVRCSAFLSSITFPIYFRNGMQHGWLMLSSFSRTFIYWSKIWKIQIFWKILKPWSTKETKLAIWCWYWIIA